MITLTDITQHYGVRPVLKDINLHIMRGELVALLGPNGMGKSTLLGVMGGVLAPQRGTVTIDKMVRRQSVEDELTIRRKTLYLPDRPWLPANRTGRDFLLSVGRLYDIPADRLMDHAQRLLELFDLGDKGDTAIRSFSAGQQKKVALSSALITECPVLLFDEPFSGGLDPSGLIALKRVLRALVENKKATIVVSSPVPELIEEVADRIVILREGQIAAFDTLDGLRRAAGIQGSLGQVLERVMFPDTARHLERYLETYSQ
jgi:ABC-type multidrug transport system ATPase subunit